MRRGAALGGEREAAHRHRAAAARAAGVVGGGARRASQRRATRAKRSGPRSSIVATQPRAASAKRSRSGCSNPNQGSPGRREAAAIAVGSASRGRATVTLASVSAAAGAADRLGGAGAQALLVAGGQRVGACRPRPLRHFRGASVRGREQRPGVDRPITVRSPYAAPLAPVHTPSPSLCAAALAGLCAPAVAPAAEGQIIVRFEPGADAQERAEARSAAEVVRDESVALPRTRVRHPHRRDDRDRGRGRPRAAPEVAMPSRTSRARALRTPNDSSFWRQWALENMGRAIFAGWSGTAGDDIDVVPAWDLVTESTAKIAVVDSGVALDHPDLRANPPDRGGQGLRGRRPPTTAAAMAPTSQARSAPPATTRRA